MEPSDRSDGVALEYRKRVPVDQDVLISVATIVYVI